MRCKRQLRLPGKIEPARMVLLQGQRDLGLLQGLVVFSQFLEPEAVDLVWPRPTCSLSLWPGLFPNRRSSRPCTSRPPADSARRKTQGHGLVVVDVDAVRSQFDRFGKVLDGLCLPRPSDNLALPQRVQDVHVAGQFLLEYLQVIDGIPASSLGHGGIDQFPPHPLDRWPRPAGLAFPAPAPILPGSWTQRRTGRNSTYQNPIPRGLRNLAVPEAGRPSSSDGVRNPAWDCRSKRLPPGS